MINLFFISNFLNVLMTDDKIERFLKNNTMDQQYHESEPRWSFLHFKQDKVLFNQSLLSEKTLTKNKEEMNDKSFTESEKFMFYVLNYNLEDIEAHRHITRQLTSNVLINIFNPIKYDWARDYVRYVVTNQDTYKSFIAFNNNIIDIITNRYSFEWIFSRILCRSDDTSELLKSLFSKERLKNLAPEDHNYIVLHDINRNKYNINLFVIYLEIRSYINTISQNNIYYYELCGLSSYLFGLLSIFESYRVCWHFTKSLPENSLIIMENLQQSMITLYQIVLLIEYQEKYNITQVSDTIIDLIYKCLNLLSGCSDSSIIKAFECLKIIRIIHQRQVHTLRSQKFFNYLRSYILIISMYSEKYVNDLHSMLTAKDRLELTNIELFFEIEGFYKLSMFLTTE
ncbi:hypothetical protein NBO_395g0003 [Nosema bombycis CQ1]|uniref:Uncharacterized protein n=1 Tax=Nosema bombycis (strain CQ1 / CVCC 102059) TaxID=578461 RepID=R0MEQ9_NOSB1|nr:hypothetical protein NBO_395g0003 [Nosema bombycis CQ1]|eukprot:EOB12620.1 hypothetical protein NBO_395g0003 [Nosema bombycis CQ1]